MTRAQREVSARGEGFAAAVLGKRASFFRARWFAARKARGDGFLVYQGAQRNAAASFNIDRLRASGLEETQLHLLV